MNLKNPYEYLKRGTTFDARPVDAQSTWVVTDSSEETVTIFTSILPSGAWVYGYSVNWASGTTSAKAPTADLGLFASQRAAKLYAVGFMLLYLEYFTPETVRALRRAEGSLIQNELF